MPREKSCGAVVFKKNCEVKYLLLHYREGHWGFVKGQIEANESERETAMRELEEETGITDAEFIGDFREQIHYYFRRRGRTIYKEVAYFLVEAKEGNVKLSYEHNEYEWLNYQEASAKLTFNNSRNVLKKAREYI